MTIHRTLLANLPQSRLRSLHQQAVKDDDHLEAETISQFIADGPRYQSKIGNWITVNEWHKPGDCICCGGNEKTYTLKKGVNFICSSCVAVISAMNQRQLRVAYHTAVKSGQTGKAKAISKFIDGDIEHEQARTTRPSMERKRPVRTTRPARYEIRA
jgi:hypothetical protein